LSRYFIPCLWDCGPTRDEHRSHCIAAMRIGGWRAPQSRAAGPSRIRSPRRAPFRR
jgi:hypothetical protein